MSPKHTHTHKSRDQSILNDFSLGSFCLCSYKLTTQRGTNTVRPQWNNKQTGWLKVLVSVVGSKATRPIMLSQYWPLPLTNPKQIRSLWLRLQLGDTEGAQLSTSAGTSMPQLMRPPPCADKWNYWSKKTKQKKTTTLWPRRSPCAHSYNLPYQPQAAGVSQQEVDCKKKREKNDWRCLR